MGDRIAEIKERLRLILDGKWRYNPKHEMFVGSTNALETPRKMIDLGRNYDEWVPYYDETGKQRYRLSKDSEECRAYNKALGEFLENCREDIAYLLERLDGQEKASEKLPQ